MAIPWSSTLWLHEQSRVPSLGCRYVVAHPQTVLLTPPTPNTACDDFVSLYATVDGLPTTASGLQHWAINLQEHADPATPEVDERHFRYFNTHPTAFPFRPQGRLLQFSLRGYV